MPTSVYVASVIQLSLECLAIIFPLLAVTIWMNNSDTITARDVAFDWVAGLLGAGQTREKMRRQCMDECEGALEKPGDAGDYDPNKFTKATETVTLENDEMAALWMDCVEEQSCENLAEGYCSPVW